MSQKWYRSVGPCADTVISTRVRLARNLKQYPFPRFMNDKQREEVVNRVKEAAAQISGLPLRAVELASCPQRERLAMVERHIISHGFASEATGVLLVSEDESVSIMINEEDHLRIQVMVPGMDFESAFALADRIDNAFDERLQFAFDDRLGYLTQCPTNLGTGMRASLMLHLPALQERGVIQSLAGTVSKLGMTVRGAYGEGSRPVGAMYQMSNQVTLGISEAAAIENLTGIAKQIMDQERAARKEDMATDLSEDRVWRSYGILRSARMMTEEEAIERLSDVRAAVSADWIDDLSLETVTSLMHDVQAGCLMADAGEDMSPEVRDRRRACLVRTALGGA